MQMSSLQHKNQNNDYEIPNAASDSISEIAFCPTQDFLAASDWSGTVSCWQIQKNLNAAAPHNFQAQPKVQYKHKAPALCCAITHDGKIVSGGCDNVARIKALPGANLGTSNNATELEFGKHDAPIKAIRPVQDINMIITGSWDKTLKYWDARMSSTNPAGSVNLPERVYAMDVKKNVAVVACAPKAVVGIDLRKPSQIMHSSESSLKHQTRTISLFNDLSGYAIGSIEGRSAIEYFQTKGFAFKCHRDNNDVYPVHSISVHPRYGTFCTAGGDGKFHFWDKDARHRLQAFQNCGAPVVSTCFNSEGSVFAYATSYDFAKGPEPTYFDKSIGGHIYLHFASDNEILQKDKRK
mmetsp:Transcript_9758/g.36354  ORF Transcript_9758/g.36354 Transcript_9758/m.36354 type:complete len:352 (-) Transcript_9758:162-1217(-)